MSPVAAQQSWVGQLADWSSIVSATVAVLVLVVGIWVANPGYQKLALLNRRRHWIGRALPAAGLHASALQLARTSWRLYTRRMRDGSASVRDELIWLSGLSPAPAAEAGLPADFPVPIPFTFSPGVLAKGYARSLGELAAAYDAYASSVRRRWLLRSAAGPLVAQEYECARQTADLLRRWASFEPVLHHADPDQLRGRQVDLAAGSQPCTVRLVTWPDMAASRTTPVFPVIGVSYQPYRVVVRGSPAGDSRGGPGTVREVGNVLGADLADPLTFDGVLPRWHGPGFRLETDRITGRQKLHLCLSETTYFAFRATQVPAAARLAGQDAGCSRLLTLNLLVIDEHDVVLLVRRSDYVVHAGRYTGTVSGNAELAPREGLQADLDGHGLPDPLAALAREAREELGLDVTATQAQLGTLGVIEVSGETELGTHILVATARVPGHARDFTVDRAAVDPIEGLWEIGDQFMTADLGAALRDRDAGERFVSWLRTSPELTPNGSGSLLLLLTTRLELRQQQAQRAARNRRSASPPGWTTRDLAAWLKAPPPDSAARVDDMVRTRSLWR